MQAAEIKKNLPQHHKRQNLLTKHTCIFTGTSLIYTTCWNKKKKKAQNLFPPQCKKDKSAVGILLDFVPEVEVCHQLVDDDEAVSEDDTCLVGGNSTGRQEGLVRHPWRKKWYQ